MEATERALFERSVRHATTGAIGAGLDAALDELGWRDALSADRAPPSPSLFECPGCGARHLLGASPLAAATPSACDATAAARRPARPSRPWHPPGTVGGPWPRCRAWPPAAGAIAIRCSSSPGPDAAIAAFGVRHGVAARRPVHGLDPALRPVAR